MNAQEIIRAAIPDADDATCEHVLYGRTPFPFAHVSARALYRAADRLRRATASGRPLCDFCDALAAPGDYSCQACRGALSA